MGAFSRQAATDRFWDEKNAPWGNHPAYEALLEIFKKAHINNGPTLAYYIITGLAQRGMDILKETTQ